MLVAGTVALWGYYGTAVFYETIVAASTHVFETDRTLVDENRRMTPQSTACGCARRFPAGLALCFASSR